MFVRPKNNAMIPRPLSSAYLPAKGCNVNDDERGYWLRLQSRGAAVECLEGEAARKAQAEVDTPAKEK